MILTPLEMSNVRHLKSFRVRISLDARIVNGSLIMSVSLLYKIHITG